MRQVEKTLSEQMRIGEHEIERRKALLQLSSEDFTRLQACQGWIEPYIPAMVKEFYIKQTSIPEIEVVIGDKETLNKLHHSMSGYIHELFSGVYDLAYVDKRLRIGKVHWRIGVSPKFYLSGISQLQQIIERYIIEQSENSADIIASLRKLFYFDNQLVFDTYIAALKNEVDLVNTQLEDYARNLEQNVAERTKELTELSLKDPLTGLYNQRAFYEELERYSSLAKRNSAHMTLLYIDMNKFKETNDTFGHKAGDSVLVAFAEAVRAILRKNEPAARYGGDEFCIIMPNTKIEEALSLCQRLAGKFSKLIGYPVTLSIGGASLYPGSDYNSEELISLADKQMYKAKAESRKSGKHQFSFERREDSDNITPLKKS
ncbi:GGDEF domain-containing protein [Vibrio sp. JC009]|uniref:GGDEF domain-containing protein n=1 Tax=Vibrio sp. JC009 TaxID=2912314 RepID=UPI0023AF0AD4|nr:GGDEF domain-containing protein [Vibrio sp. JC009]WED24205.1 GGDEF domain-containing protein [Vibrio sp. JC009]